jgi:hypothetical protein
MEHEAAIVRKVPVQLHALVGGEDEVAATPASLVGVAGRLVHMCPRTRRLPFGVRPIRDVRAATAPATTIGDGQ